MSEKPEALRLAEELTMNCHAGTQQNAAASLLRRLHADNERLRDELRQSSIDHTRAEVERLREVLKLALNSHGRMLMSDPPQDPWKVNRVDEVIRELLQEDKT